MQIASTVASSLPRIPFARGFAKLKERSRGTPYVPRLVARKTLNRAASRRRGDHKDRTLLLPPFVSAAELRIIFHLDYSGVLRVLGIKKEAGKFFWKDFDGRTFETANKRRILVPYEIAAVPAQGLGLIPKMLDVEPDWRDGAPGAGGVSSAAAVPVVAVLGHINHGKTTLLDQLCGTVVAPTEPGGITQDVRATTGWFESFTRVANENEAALSSQVTFLDTPGHEAFEIHRGRTMACADLAVVVISVERGAEVQTEEVLMHASRWKVPVVFALNKIDLPDTHLDLTRAELRRQCQRLQENGHVTQDWTREAEMAVPISALHGWGLDRLLERLRRVLSVHEIPRRPTKPLSSTPGEAARCKDILRRTDFLVGVESAPFAVGLVVDVEKDADQGETVLTVIVRRGRLAMGQQFAVGTAFGKVSSLALASGHGFQREALVDSATTGTTVLLKGIKKRMGGDCSQDDLVFALPRERAWRLSEHRRRIEALTQIQTSGPTIDVAWEHDGMESRTQAAFQRSREAQPEKHSSSAHKHRSHALNRPAVEEFGADAGVEPLFGQQTRAEFRRKFRKVGHPESEEGSEDEAPEREIEEFSDLDGSAPARGRRSARRFLAATPAEPESDEPLSRRSSGRRSRRAFGAWSEPLSRPTRDFKYFAEETGDFDEASRDTAQTRSRWQWRDRERWVEEERQAAAEREQKATEERVRCDIFGEQSPPPKAEQEDESEDDVEPLPPRFRPVVPLILKTRTLNQFDVLMDELEAVQQDLGCRVVIVHGGLGPVIAKDIVHAEVEKQYGYCPVYAFQVGVHPVATGQAHREKIDIQRFDVFTELVDTVAGRCQRVHDKEESVTYKESLRSRPTVSGW